MKIRQKSLWRSQNTKHWRKRANQRAAKERKRMERAAREESVPDASHVKLPKRDRPLFVITVRCRDNNVVRMAIKDGPFGIMPCATTVGRKVAAILRHYRPGNPKALWAH